MWFAQVAAILSRPQCVEKSSMYLFVCFSGFDFYGEGEMVLYRHDTLPYEVRPFIRRCGNVACNCAVAILSGDDVILIESCGPRDAPYPAGTLTVKFYLNGELNPGTSLTRYNGGLKYEVCEKWVVIKICKEYAKFTEVFSVTHYFLLKLN